MRRSLSLIIMMLASGLGLAITPAGTVIRNQGRVVLGGEAYLSNEVDTVVKAICLPQLGPNGSAGVPGQYLSAPVGGVAYLPYVVTNAGNDRYRFTLSLAVQAASAWLPVATRVVLDADANGRADSGEVAVTELTLDSAESARVVVEVRVPTTASGAAYVNLVSACPNGVRDEDNVGRVDAVDGPALQPFKTATRARIGAGEEVGFRLRLVNLGSLPTDGEVVLTDRFDTPALVGFRYLPGSAQASQGQLEHFDGSGWSASEPAEVRGLRLRLDSLAVGEEASLEFAMVALATAEPGVHDNVALVTGPGGPAQVGTEVEIVARRDHQLGPGGNPRALPGGEAGRDDTQRADFIVFGQPYCFAHSLENSGNLQDDYRLDIAGLPAGVSATLVTPNGPPLANPVELDPGEVRAFSLCFTASEVTGAFAATLTAVSLASGVGNVTFDTVGQVLPGDRLELNKSADATGTVSEGQELSYTLRLRNDNPFVLSDLRIVDELQPLRRESGAATPAGLTTEFVAASGGGVFDAASRSVLWRLAELASGEAVELTLTVRLPSGSPPGAVFTLDNAFEVTAQELPNPLVSNAVHHSYPTIGILVDKQVGADRVRVGDVLHYTVTVANPNEVSVRLLITDTLPPRTAYLEGSAVLSLGEDGEDAIALEPAAEGERLVWDLREVAAFELAPAGGPGDRLLIRYALRLLPGAEGELVNVVSAEGTFVGSEAGEVAAAATSTAAITVIAAATTPGATLVGRVFLDVDEDGRYDAGRDLPLAGARVLLTNGWQALSDAEGRYAFRELAPGTWSLMLDPVSAPFRPLPHPAALGDGYRRRVVVQGLTVSDVALEAPVGAITATRRTVLVFGPLQLEKSLIPLPGATRVVLALSSAEPLPDLTVIDPLPGGGVRTFEFARFEGEQTITYDLDGTVPLTDPQARWRYP